MKAKTIASIVVCAMAMGGAYLYYLRPSFVENYIKQADSDDVFSQHTVGVIYELGDGVEQDFKKAATYYSKAVEQGCAASMHNLGLMYKDGRGVEKDERMALNLIKKASKQKLDHALNTLGELYLKGDLVAQDLTKARKFFKESSDKNLGLAKLNLATLYIKGQGGEKDLSKAVELLRDAGNIGAKPGAAYPIANYRLGQLYLGQDSVEKNLTLARYFFKKAAKFGHDGAKKSLKNLEK